MIALWLWILLASPAPGYDCYGPGNAAYADEAFGAAGEAFEASAGHAACLPARGRLFISAGEAYRREAQRTGEPEWSCRALDAYRAAHRLGDRRRIVDAANAGIVALEPLCARPEVTPAPAAEPPTAEPPDDGFPLGWAALGVGVAAAVTLGVVALMPDAPETEYRVWIRLE